MNGYLSIEASTYRGPRNVPVYGLANAVMQMAPHPRHEPAVLPPGLVCSARLP